MQIWPSSGDEDHLEVICGFVLGKPLTVVYMEITLKQTNLACRFLSVFSFAEVCDVCLWYLHLLSMCTVRSVLGLKAEGGRAELGCECILTLVSMDAEISNSRLKHVLFLLQTGM